MNTTTKTLAIIAFAAIAVGCDTEDNPAYEAPDAQKTDNLGMISRDTGAVESPAQQTDAGTQTDTGMPNTNQPPTPDATVLDDILGPPADGGASDGGGSSTDSGAAPTDAGASDTTPPAATVLNPWGLPEGPAVGLPEGIALVPAGLLFVAYDRTGTPRICGDTISPYLVSFSALHTVECTKGGGSIFTLINGNWGAGGVADTFELLDVGAMSAVGNAARKKIGSRYFTADEASAKIKSYTADRIRNAITTALSLCTPKDK